MVKTQASEPAVVTEQAASSGYPPCHRPLILQQICNSSTKTVLCGQEDSTNHDIHTFWLHWTVMQLGFSEHLCSISVTARLHLFSIAHNFRDAIDR